MYFFAETAFHHEGDLNYMYQLIDAAKLSGVDGVKFQVLLDIDSFISSEHSSYYEVRSWLFTLDEWKAIISYAVGLELDVVLLPLDAHSLQLIDDFQFRYIEIHSVLFSDEMMISSIIKTNLPIILGVGGRSVDEIARVVTECKGREVVLMVGFQAYPSDIKDVRLKQIPVLMSIFPGVIIGYADHSSFSDRMSVVSNDYAYILGARVFEKHITVSEGVERVDYHSAVTAETLSTIVENINSLDQVFSENSSSVFDMCEKEAAYRSRQKSPVSIRRLRKGDCVSSQDITFKMIDTVDKIENVGDIVGMVLSRDIAKDKAFKEEYF